MTELARALLAELREDPATLVELRRLLVTATTVYTPATLAAELNMTARAVRAAIDRGDLEARRSGRGWVITAEAVAAWGTPGPRRAAHTTCAGALEPRDADPARRGLARISSIYVDGV